MAVTKTPKANVAGGGNTPSPITMAAIIRTGAQTLPPAMATRIISSMMKTAPAMRPEYAAARPVGRAARLYLRHDMNGHDMTSVAALHAESIVGRSGARRPGARTRSFCLLPPRIPALLAHGKTDVLLSFSAVEHITTR
jgi:hypothetical protein